MPQHRVVFYFLDEQPTDRAAWEAWLAAAPPRVRAIAELGERRPFVSAAAPFAGRDAAETRRNDEAAGLEVVKELVENLGALAGATARSIGLLLAGRGFGTVGPDGPDAALTAKLEEWGSLVEARPPDEPEWERKGWVSVWAGTVPREDYDHLLRELHAIDGPISAFARAIHIRYYDKKSCQGFHSREPLPAGAAIGKLPFAASFLDLIPAEVRERVVNAVIVLYETDFTERPRDAARRRLRYCGSYPYKG